MRSLSIKGPIESADPFLASLRAASGHDVTVEIDSIGGSVWAGCEIFTALTRHAGLVTVRIVGLAASMASAVAMAGDEIVIEPSARMMLHSPSGSVHGRSGDLRSMASLLDRIEATMRSAYATRSGRPMSEISAMMQAETWLSADEAVAAGFADRVAGRKQTTAEGLQAISASVYRAGPWARTRL